MSTSTYYYHTTTQTNEQLVQEIYTQLLELYTFDLEIELLAEKLNNTQRGIPQSPVPTHPWQQPPVWYGPYTPYQPYKVTCLTS